MSDFKIKIKAELVSAELMCINCKQRIPKKIKETLQETHWGNFRGLVSEEYKCEKCGCNTFDVDFEVQLNSSF